MQNKEPLKHVLILHLSCNRQSTSTPCRSGWTPVHHLPFTKWIKVSQTDGRTHGQKLNGVDKRGSRYNSITTIKQICEKVQKKLAPFILCHHQLKSEIFVLARAATAAHRLLLATWALDGQHRRHRHRCCRWSCVLLSIVICALLLIITVQLKFNSTAFFVLECIKRTHTYICMYILSEIWIWVGTCKSSAFAAAFFVSQKT